MRNRSISAWLALSVLGSFVSGCKARSPAQRLAELESATSPHGEVEVVALKYAPADEVARVLAHSASDRNVRVEVYARTNSLVLAGGGAAISELKQAIAKLDIQAK